MDVDNPAARLLELLRGAKKLPPRASMDDGLRELLGLKSRDPLELWARLAAFLQLPDDARQAVKRLALRDEPLHLRWTVGVNKALAKIDFHENFYYFQNSIDDLTLQSLEYASSKLSDESPEVILEGDPLAALTQSIAFLRTQVSGDATLPVDLKELLLFHLREIDKSIDEYRVRGVAGVRAAFERAFGAMAARDASSKIAETRPDSWRRSYGFFQGVIIAISITANLAQITGVVHQLMLPSHEAASTPPAGEPTIVKEGEIMDDPRRA